MDIQPSPAFEGPDYPALLTLTTENIGESPVVGASPEGKVEQEEG